MGLKAKRETETSAEKLASDGDQVHAMATSGCMELFSVKALIIKNVTRLADRPVFVLSALRLTTRPLIAGPRRRHRFS
jgi:hypothetical protein